MIKGNIIKKQLNLNIFYFSTHACEAHASYTQKLISCNLLGKTEKILCSSVSLYSLDSGSISGIFQTFSVLQIRRIDFL